MVGLNAGTIVDREFWDELLERWHGTVHNFGDKAIVTHIDTVFDDDITVTFQITLDFGDDGQEEVMVWGARSEAEAEGFLTYVMTIADSDKPGEGVDGAWRMLRDEYAEEVRSWTRLVRGNWKAGRDEAEQVEAHKATRLAERIASSTAGDSIGAVAQLLNEQPWLQVHITTMDDQTTGLLSIDINGDRTPGAAYALAAVQRFMGGRWSEKSPVADGTALYWRDERWGILQVSVTVAQ